MERQTRETDRQIRRTDQTQRQIVISDIQTEKTAKKIERPDRKTDQTDQTDRQTRQTDRQTDRQTTQTGETFRQKHRQKDQTEKTDQTDRMTRPTDLYVWSIGLSVCLFIWYVCLSIFLSVCLSVSLSFSPSVCLSVWFVCLVCMSVYLICLSVFLVCQSFCLVYFFCLVRPFWSVCQSVRSYWPDWSIFLSVCLVCLAYFSFSLLVCVFVRSFWFVCPSGLLVSQVFLSAELVCLSCVFASTVYLYFLSVLSVCSVLFLCVFGQSV